MRNSKSQIANRKCWPPASRGQHDGRPWLMALICYLLFAHLPFAATAQPPDLPLLERRAADKSLSPREREQAIDQAIEARRALIAAGNDADPALREHLINQAAALLSRPARDGSDTAVLLGIPLPAQLKSVTADASEAAACLKRAKSAADALAEQFAATPPPPDDPRPERLTQDRTVRIPFYRGRAESLLAVTAPKPETASHLAAVADSLAKLALASTAPECIRRVTYGAALLLRAGDGDAKSALEEFAYVATTPEPAPGAIPPQTRVEGWMGLVRAAAALGTVEQAIQKLHDSLSAPPFIIGGHPDPLWTVLAADAGAVAFTEQAIHTHKVALLENAITEESSLLARDDLGFRAEALRPLVFEKLAILADRAAAAKLDPPPGMRLAQAIVAARDPARRDDAVAAFAAVADNPKAGDFAADALWEQAVLLTQPGKTTPASRLAAARALTRLAREHDASPRAAEAMSAALAYARTLESDHAPDAAQSRAAYLDALVLATTKYESLPDIDLWRVERARLLVPAGSESPSLDDLSAALAQLFRVTPRSTVADDARRLFERAQVLLSDKLAPVLAEARRISDSAAREVGRQRLRPAAELAAEFAAAHKSPFLDRFRADLADAIVESGSPASRETYQSLLASNAQVPGGRPRLQLGLARSLIISNDKAAAFPLLQEAAGALDTPPAPGAAAPTRPDTFWHAWTLSLELLADQNKDGSRSGAILAHLRRLELIDPTLGGPPWVARITAVKSRISR